MDLGIVGRRAAVAAASSGLGLAAASALAAEGVRVALCSRDGANIAAAARRVGHGAVPITEDVSTAEGAARFACAAAEALGGPLDILVANCGGPPFGPFDSFAPADYLPALEANLLATVAMCTEALPAMRAQGWGRVVAVTSTTVRQPHPQLVLSTTARAGLTGYLKTVAREVAADGVTVNSVLPSAIETDRTRQASAEQLRQVLDTIPAGSLGRPEDFGAVVAFLCSEHARFVTGTALAVDGGLCSALF